MEIKVVQKTVYVTDDGQEFTSKEDAKSHFIYQYMWHWADRVALCSGGEWDADMVIQAILEDLDIIGLAEKLKNIDTVSAVTDPDNP